MPIRRLAAAPAAILAERGPGGLGGGQTAGEVGLHTADPALVGLRVEPEPAR